MSEKIKNPESKVRPPSVYIPYYSDEFRDVVKFIQDVLKKKVYLIGVRALFERGIPLFRFTDDFDIHSPISTDERDKLIKYVRKKYEKSKHVWSRFGFGLDFEPIGHVDVNVIPPSIYDESWEKDLIEINAVKVYLPPAEDVLVMKLLSPRVKDRKDAGVALRLGKDKIDMERLKTKANKAGVMKKLIKIAKRYHVEIE
ncbi:MAG: hypothetical protein FGF53_10280 [Candidatus Brockarchaeota archaeon]|nr:hypothetical protein [Candidatus Brockarchaeota archaeon]